MSGEITAFKTVYSGGNLRDRLKGVFRKLSDLENGGHWALPRFPTDPKLGLLRRSNRNN